MRWLLSTILVLGVCHGLSSAQEDSVDYDQEEFLDYDQDEFVDCESDVQCDFGDPCCGSCVSPGHRFWGRVDYLTWWTKGSRLPPLITASPEATQPNEQGVLGLPNTSILYGDQYVNHDLRSGFRVSGGFWLDRCHTIGIGADYLDLGAANAHGEASDTATWEIARPFFNVQTGSQAAQPLPGDITVDSRDYFQSAGSWFRVNLVNCPCAAPCCSSSCCDTCCDSCCSSGCSDCCGWGYGIDLLMGYRYYRMTDSLTIHEDIVDDSGGSSNGTAFDITDDFRTENQFHGGEIGFRTRVERGCWSLGLLTKLAIGNNQYAVTIDGSTTTVILGFAPTYDANGILATQSNIGRYEDDQFTIIPQLGLEVGYQVCCNVDLFVGYNLIYWPHVQRSADQIDPNVDPRNWPPVQSGPLPFPAPKLCSTDYWAQGINFGVGCRY